MQDVHLISYWFKRMYLTENSLRFRWQGLHDIQVWDTQSEVQQQILNTLSKCQIKYLMKSDHKYTLHNYMVSSLHQKSLRLCNEFCNTIKPLKYQNVKKRLRQCLRCPYYKEITWVLPFQWISRQTEASIIEVSIRTGSLLSKITIYMSILGYYI